MSHSGDVEGPVLPSVPPPPVHKVRAEDIVTEVGKKAGKDESSHGFGAGSSRDVQRTASEILADPEQQRLAEEARRRALEHGPHPRPRARPAPVPEGRGPRMEELAIGATILCVFGIFWDWAWGSTLRTAAFIALVVLLTCAYKYDWFARLGKWLSENATKAYNALQDLGRDELPERPDEGPSEGDNPRPRGRRKTSTILWITFFVYLCLFPVMHVAAIRMFGMPYTMEERIERQFSAFATKVEDLANCPLGERLVKTWMPTLYGWRTECQPLIFDLDEKVLHAAFQEAAKEIYAGYLGVSPRMYRNRSLVDIANDALEFSRRWGEKAERRGQLAREQMDKLKEHYEQALTRMHRRRVTGSAWHHKFTLAPPSSAEAGTTSFLTGTTRAVNQINLSILQMARQMTDEADERGWEVLQVIDRAIARAAQDGVNAIKGQLQGELGAVRELMPTVLEQTRKLAASADMIATFTRSVQAPPARTWGAWAAGWYGFVMGPAHWAVGLLRFVISPNMVDGLQALLSIRAAGSNQNLGLILLVLALVGILMTLALIATVVKRIADGVHSVVDLGQDTMRSIYSLTWGTAAVLYFPFWVAYWLIVQPLLFIGSFISQQRAQPIPVPPPQRPRRARTAAAHQSQQREQQRGGQQPATQPAPQSAAPRQEANMAPPPAPPVAPRQEANMAAPPPAPPAAPSPTIPQGTHERRGQGRGHQGRGRDQGRRGRGQGRGRGRGGRRTGYNSDEGQPRQAARPFIAWEDRPASDGEAEELPQAPHPVVLQGLGSIESILDRLHRVEERQAAAARGQPPPMIRPTMPRPPSPGPSRTPRMGRPAVPAIQASRLPPPRRCANCNARDHATGECPHFWQQVVHVPEEQQRAPDEGPSDRPPVAAVWDAATSSDPSRLYYVRAKLAEGTNPVQMLVDSGSSVCVMPTERCVQGGWEIQPLPEPMEVQAFNGVTTQVRGRVGLPVDIGGETRQVPFLVVDGPEHPIVGVNALRDFGWSLDFAGNRLVAPDGRSVMCAAVRAAHHPN